MRILILHRELPFPADNGGKLRSAHVARYLAAHHQVSLLCFGEPGHDSDFPERNLFCDFQCLPSPKRKFAVRRLLSGVPSEVVDLQCSNMKRAIAKIVDDRAPDVILISDLGMTAYLEPYADRVRVLDYLMVQTLSIERLAAISKGLQRWIWKLRWLRSVAYHRRMARLFDLCLVNSQEDLADLLANSPGWRNLEFFPNGLSLTEYPLGLAEPVPNTLIYPGSVTYISNRDAVEYMIQRILPRVQARIPDVRLIVTGAVPDDGTAPQGPGVVYTGRVPDVRPVIAGAWACVVPLRSGAGGTRFKVLEAMALGTPIVSSSIGAEGIDWTDGSNICIRDTPEEFADSTIRLLQDIEYRNRLSMLGRQLIEQRYDWNILGAKLSGMLGQLRAAANCRG